MQTYRCYFVGNRNTGMAGPAIEAPNPKAAVRRAAARAPTQNYERIEIWLGADRVLTWSRTRLLRSQALGIVSSAN